MEMMKQTDVRAFFTRLRAQNPEPQSELNWSNPFTLLVAVVLSAQATDAGVNRATQKLFEIASTPEAMLDLGLEGLKRHIKTIGLYNNKAKNVIALSHMLVDEFASEVPKDRDALERLPGVGRKTANVVLNVCWNEPTMAVDTHIFRVANRTGLGPGKTPLAVEQALLKQVPGEFMAHAHHWLILHGRYVCKARKPDCANCIVSDLCAYDTKTTASI